MRYWMGAALLAVLSAPAMAEGPADGAGDRSPTAKPDGVPPQLDPAQRDGYRTVFAAIHDGRWSDATLALDGMVPGPLHSIARAEIFVAHGSPRVEAQPLVDLLTQAPELPEAEALARLARARGAADLPALPVAQRMTWIDGAPARVHTRSVKSDLIAADLAVKMQPYVKDDQGAPAQALLEATDGLSPEAETEWRQKVGWIYYLQGDDADARAMGAQAAKGVGDWATQGEWLTALASWRQADWATAARGFEAVASRAADTEMRAAGLYWAARADLAGGRPDRVEGHLRDASQYRETFYGLLARQALGIRDPKARPGDRFVAADWLALQSRPNVRVAAALTEVGEDALADQVIRRQALIGDPADYAPLVRLAAQLDLPASVVWLSHNGPAGVTPPVAARYPAPNWTPDGGWRVDKALLYAHALQESGFRRTAVSPKGAYGLMQIMPSVAKDYVRAHGGVADRATLTAPSTNMELGQTALERLRDGDATGGLLPKVIAAYNAGPLPVQMWNALSRDGGDPLLYIESIPYWETRGYVMTVLRNYWMYEGQTGRAASASRAALAQGMWPRFPGMKGAAAVRIRTVVPKFVAPIYPVAPLPTLQMASATRSPAPATTATVQMARAAARPAIDPGLMVQPIPVERPVQVAAARPAYVAPARPVAAPALALAAAPATVATGYSVPPRTVGAPAATVRVAAAPLARPAGARAALAQAVAPMERAAAAAAAPVARAAGEAVAAVARASAAAAAPVAHVSAKAAAAAFSLPGLGN